MNEKKRTIGGLIKGLLALAVASSPNISAQVNSDNIIELSPFEVSADAGGSLYSINQSSSGTRITAVVRDLPFSLDVLTMDYLDDFHYADPTDAMSEISNVGVGTPQNGAGAGAPTRGFAQYYALRDGFYRNGVVDKTLIDRVEVLKGPYAAIYGRGEPGGVTNFIPKVPVYGENAGEMHLQYGQNNTYRIQLEQNVAIGEKTALLVASSYYERDFDLEYSYERTRNIGAMLRHKLTDRDEITFDFEKMVRRNNRGHTIPEMRADVAGTYNGLTLKKNDYLPYFGMDFLNENGYINGRGNYWWGERHIEQYGVKWTHRFSDAVNLRVKYGNQVQDQPYNNASSGNGVIRVDENLNFVRWDSTANPTYNEINEGGRALNVDLTVNWNIGESKQTTLLTYDDSFTDKDRYDIRPVLPAEETARLQADRFNIYRDFREYSPATYTGPNGYSNVTRNLLYHTAVEGVFLMHRAKFFDDKLLVMAGTRADTAKTTETDLRTSGITATNASDNTYNVGVNYNITPRTMVYASHATSFDPKGGFYTDAGRAPLPNESGKGNEIGIRTSFFDDKVNFSLSYYDIEKFNVKTANPAYDENEINPATGYKNVPDLGDLDSGGNLFTQDQIDGYRDAYRDLVSTVIPGGVNTASGYELSANGRVNDNLSFRAAWGTCDTEYEKTDVAYLLGQSFNNVPYWTYSFSANYRVIEGSLKGMSFGLSYQGQDSFRGENRDWIGGDNRWYWQTDNMLNLKLNASYSWKGEDRTHKVAISMDNVMDRISVTKSFYQTEGRNVQASYTLKY